MAVLAIAAALGVTTAGVVADECAYQNPACTRYNNHSYVHADCEFDPGDACYLCHYSCDPGYVDCGMEVVPCGKRIGDIVATAESRFDDFDFFFLHVKQTDQAGEDGNLEQKVAAIEEVDAALPRLLALGPDVIAVTGDHSTPAPMKGHSFHPVPLLLAGPHGEGRATVFADAAERFDELACVGGHLGTFPSRALLALLLAHAGRLQKFGA